MDSRPPNFVILGAQKCGTTSLHRLLDQHPDLFMSKPIKESNYFYSDEQLANYCEAYSLTAFKSKALYERAAMLAGYRDELLIGEACPAYTYGTTARRWGIPARMCSWAPQLKFLYIMRCPLERIYSAYTHVLKKERITVSFRSWLGKNGETALETSRYYTQLNEYLRFFPASNFFLCSLEKLKADPQGLCTSIFTFLNIPDHEIEPVHLNKGFSSDASFEEEVLAGHDFESYRRILQQDTSLLESKLSFRESRWTAIVRC